MIASTYNILHTCIVLIYYNYLLITDRIVKILVLSIVSLQLAVSKIFSSDFKIDHLDIKNNVYNRSSPVYIEHILLR